MEKHIRANAELIPKITWRLLEQYPEVCAVCDEANSNHVNIRERESIAFIKKIAYLYFADEYDVALVAIKKPNEIAICI